MNGTSHGSTPAPTFAADAVPLIDRAALARLPIMASLAAIETEFIGRIFATPAARYLQTTRGLGFTGRSHVVDLGAGYGQWAAALAGDNTLVTAVEPQAARVAFTGQLAAALGVTNLHAVVGSAEAVPLEDGCADAVFCFGVLQYVDAAGLFAECARLLRPGGMAYVIGKGVGGYVFDWCEQNNRSAAFDPRRVAADAFMNTLSLEATGAVHAAAAWRDRITPLEAAEALATASGFRVEHAGPEGSRVEATGAALAYPSHFFRREYRGLPFSYELVLTR